jgi:hypothetical protein
MVIRREDIPCNSLLLQVVLELVDDRSSSSANGSLETLGRLRWEHTSAKSLGTAELELCSTKLTSSGCLLLQKLLLMSVRVANLDHMVLSAWLLDNSIVELLDDIFADVTRFETTSSEH